MANWHKNQQHQRMRRASLPGKTTTPTQHTHRMPTASSEREHGWHKSAGRWRSCNCQGQPLEFQRLLLLLLVDAKRVLVLLGHGLQLLLCWGFGAEKLVDDVKRTLVNLVVFVRLQKLDAFQTATLFNVVGVLVGGALQSGICFTNFENVFQRVQRYLKNLGVLHVEQIAQRLDAPALHQVPKLFWGASAGGVADCPRGLLAGLEQAVFQNVDERGNEVGLNDLLDLLLAASSHIGNGPARLLFDALLWAGQQGAQVVQCRAVEHNLCLGVIASDNVANGAQGRRHHAVVAVQQELDQAADDASVNHGLNLFVGPIRKVRQRPARVCQDFLVVAENEPCQCSQRLLDNEKVWRGLFASAEVGQGPRCVANHGDLGCLCNQPEEGRHNAAGEDVVATFCFVASNVAEGPHRLFPHVVVGRQKELDKVRHRVGVNHNASLLA
eukprot:m.15074 g.15074  ORF g.15074 m.15074 type:complete len:440 (+) comp4952_c0_seq1:684-2003(+)